MGCGGRTGLSCGAGDWLRVWTGLSCGAGALKALLGSWAALRGWGLPQKRGLLPPQDMGRSTLGPCGCCSALSQPRGAARAPKLKLLCVDNTCGAGGLETLTWRNLIVVAEGVLVVWGVTMYLNVYISLYISAAMHSEFPLCCLGARLLAGVNQTPPCDCSWQEERVFCCSSEPGLEWALSGCSIPSACFGETSQL